MKGRLIMLAVGVIVIATFGVVMMVVDRDADEPAELSPDCAQVDAALRIALPARMDTVTAIPGISSKPGDSARLAADEARTAADLRAVAATIGAPVLRDGVNEIADDFQAFSESRRAATDPTAWPDTRFMGALDGMMPTVRTLIEACPGVGDEMVSPP